MTTTLVKILENYGIADRKVRVHPLIAGLSEIVLTVADKRKTDDEKVNRVVDVLKMWKNVLVNNTELVSTFEVKDIDKVLRVLRELEL